MPDNTKTGKTSRNLSNDGVLKNEGGIVGHVLKETELGIPFSAFSKISGIRLVKISMKPSSSDKAN